MEIIILLITFIAICGALIFWLIGNIQKESQEDSKEEFASTEKAKIIKLNIDFPTAVTFGFGFGIGILAVFILCFLLFGLAAATFVNELFDSFS